MVMFIMGWTPKDELRLRLLLRLSLVPGRTRPCAFRTSSVPAFPMAAEVPASGMVLATIVFNNSRGGRLRHQVPILGVA
jgi:hypothetical protein